MRQSGFSSVVLLVVIVVLASIGGAGYMMMQNNSESAVEEDNGDDAATTSASGKSSNETGTKAKGVAKSKVKACDVLTLSDISRIAGMAMSLTPDMTEETMVYEDDEVWSSTCGYTETDGTVESNFGMTLMITESLSGEAKTFLTDEFENVMASEGGVSISGYGDKAFKITGDGNGYGDFGHYYVLVGNMMIIAYSGTAYGHYEEGGMPVIDSVESNDAITEGALKHVLSKIK